MTPQRLDRVLIAYRIGDPSGRHPIFDATGSKQRPGRWNTEAAPMIYASEHYSTAMLEKLVWSSSDLPPNQHYIQIMLPTGLSYEVFDPAFLPAWADDDRSAARGFGARWQAERRSAILLVPSVVARVDMNILINPEHADFPRITHGLHRPVWWDARLFGGA